MNQSGGSAAPVPFHYYGISMKMSIIRAFWQWMIDPELLPQTTLGGARDALARQATKPERELARISSLRISFVSSPAGAKAAVSTPTETVPGEALEQLAV